MTPFDSALSQILDLAKPQIQESIRCGSANGRVISEDILAPFAMPLFDNSAVDGFAIHPDDLACRVTKFELAGCIQAGHTERISLEPGTTVRIMTGAPVPEPCGAIAMQEDVALEGNIAKIQSAEVTPGQHIRQCGAEFQPGDVLIPSGTPVSPALLSLAAAINLQELKVWRKPTVAILVTGNELKQPGEKLEFGQIYESNSFGISALLELLGISATIFRLQDNLSNIKDQLGKLLAENDVVITIGGVSVGEFDFIRTAIKEQGLVTLVSSVSIKPGKPFTCAHRSSDSKILFGLPGNPMSALCTFSLFVWPYLRKTMGFPPTSWLQVLLHGESINTGNRDEFVPARLEPVGNHIQATTNETIGSHSVSGLALSNSLIRIEANSSVTSGDFVSAILLPWGQI